MGAKFREKKIQGKIGLVSMKDYDFQKILLKMFVQVEYHWKLPTIAENNIPLHLYIKNTFWPHNMDMKWRLYL